MTPSQYLSCWLFLFVWCICVCVCEVNNVLEGEVGSYIWNKAILRQMDSLCGYWYISSLVVWTLIFIENIVVVRVQPEKSESRQLLQERKVVLFSPGQAEGKAPVKSPSSIALAFSLPVKYSFASGVLQFMGLQRVGHDWATELIKEPIRDLVLYSETLCWRFSAKPWFTFPSALWAYISSLALDTSETPTRMFLWITCDNPLQP